jgi:hypothetical protein
MESIKFFDNKKFMWDGKEYSSESEAIDKKKEYEKDSFDTRMIKEEVNHFLFTRRVVTEVTTDSQ